MSVEVVEAGPMMTIQDLGRSGYASQGIAGSGALDKLSVSVLNKLLGNDPDSAVVEMVIMGGKFKFNCEVYFCVGGAEMQAMLNGRLCERYRVYFANKNDVLSLGFAQVGCHGYFAVSGGFDVDTVLNSMSTNLKCSLGGLNGSILKSGNVLKVKNGTVPEKLEVDISNEIFGNEIRVVKGLQWDMFTQEGKNTFLEQYYTVTNNYDRMGCRLSGNPIESKNGMDIISDAINFGSVQISSDGQPIVMLADRQTTGGYAKIASVISVDIPKFVQHKPGEKIKFALVTVEEAQKILRKKNKQLNNLLTNCVGR